MKRAIINIGLILVAVIITFSFTVIEEEKKEIKTQNSKVIWKAYKVTGAHQGTIELKSGYLSFVQDRLTGGKFEINMVTIINTDQEGEYKQKLERHLKSEDFFGVKKYPISTLVFKKVKKTGKNSYNVIGNLSIKGITNSVIFDISVYGNRANVSLKIDRTEYNVRYGSASFFDNLKDKVIYDEFDLVADLEF